MLQRMTNIDLYLDFVNNFLSLSAMEDHYGVDVSGRVEAGRIEYRRFLKHQEDDIELLLATGDNY